MKKNITINMMGVLYNIDEDAYELLNQYLDGMKDYFARHGDDGEIAQDIEYRIAELLNEMKADGKNVITIEDVTHICQQVGKPEEMDTVEEDEASSINSTESEKLNKSGESSESDQSRESSGTGGVSGSGESDNSGNPGNQATGGAHNSSNGTGGKRKLYRNTDDKMLGGVLSGLAQFATGGDPLPWRIAFTLLVIIGVPFISWQYLILAYLLTWMIVPGLSTPEDRLRMRGEEVSTENVQRELLNPTPQPTDNNAANGCLTALVWMFKIALFLFLGFVGMILISVLLATMALPLMGLIPGAGVLATLGGMMPSPWLSSTLIVCGALVFVIPLIALIQAIFSKRTTTWTTRIIVALVWLASLAGLCYAANEVKNMGFGNNGEFTVGMPGFNFRFYGNGVSVVPDDDWYVEDEVTEPDTLAIDTVTAIHPDGSEEVFPE